MTYHLNIFRRTVNLIRTELLTVTDFTLLFILWILLSICLKISNNMYHTLMILKFSHNQSIF